MPDLAKVNPDGTPAEKVDDGPTHSMRLYMARQIAMAAKKENWWFVAMTRHDGTQLVWSMKEPKSRRAKQHLDDQLLAIRGLMRDGFVQKWPRWVRWLLGR